MIIKLDKGDTQEVFKEFIDEATRNYIQSKVKSIVDQRVDKIIADKLEGLDLDKMLKGQINLKIDAHFKSGWNGQMDYVDKVIDKRLEKFDFKSIVEGNFTEDVASAVWRRMRQASKTAEAL